MCALDLPFFIADAAGLLQDREKVSLRVHVRLAFFIAPASGMLQGRVEGEGNLPLPVEDRVGCFRDAVEHKATPVDG